MHYSLKEMWYPKSVVSLRRPVSVEFILVQFPKYTEIFPSYLKYGNITYCNVIVLHVNMVGGISIMFLSEF